MLLLPPVVATVRVRTRPAGQGTAGRRPPIVPLSVLGFLACVALRSTGMIPTGALTAVSQLQVAALGAALFGVGAAADLLAVPRQRSRPRRVALGVLFGLVAWRLDPNP